MLSNLKRDAKALGALEDELRRTLYVFIRAQGRPISRDEAAKAAGISRKLAAFHLDKLVDRGLLTHSYARPPGRGGRGAGRPAKYYEASDREIDVTIPERRYDLLGSVLLRALRSREQGETGEEAARRAAGEAGLELGRGERERRGIPRPGPERAMSVTARILDETGYEPYRDDRGCLRLRNCPYHGLAEQERDVVCSMNERIIDGIVRGLGNETLGVVREPVPGECCVKVEPPRSRRDSPSRDH